MAKTQTTLRMDAEVLAALKARAARVGVSIDEWVERLLRKELGIDLLDRLQQRNNLMETEALTLALEAQRASRQERESGLGEAYEAAFREVENDANSWDDLRKR